MKFRETQAKKIRQLHTSRRISANLLKTKKKKKRKPEGKKKYLLWKGKNKKYCKLLIWNYISYKIMDFYNQRKYFLIR
jgi:hypothetical protein